MAQAQAVAATIELPLAWEFAPEDEFGFADLARDYFSTNATLAEQAGALFALFDAPHYFRRAGKGRFKKAPAEILQQALAAIEKKKLVLQQIEEWAGQLGRGECPQPIREQLYKILFRPDKNAPEYKAVVEASRATHTAPLDLLQKAGAIDSSYQFHWKRFLFDFFPKGTGFPAITAPQPPADLPLAPVQAYSIDDSQTTEIDDALSVQGLGTGTVVLGIHIAAPGLAIAAEGQGDWIIDTRLRYEFVDQDGFADEARALTLRARLGYETPAWEGFKALVEVEGVAALSDDYNSTTNGNVGYPTVLDPEAAELNRAQISWTGERTSLVVGRQRVILGNARFVGQRRLPPERTDLRRGPGGVQGHTGDDRHLDLHRSGAAHPRRRQPPGRVGQRQPSGPAGNQDPAGPADRLRLSARFRDRPPAVQRHLGRPPDRRAAPDVRSLDHLGSRVRPPERLRLQPGRFRPRLSGPVGRAEEGRPLCVRGAGAARRQRRARLRHAAGHPARLQWLGRRVPGHPARGLTDLNLKGGTTLPVGSRKLKLAAAIHDFSDADGGLDYGREFDASASLPLTPKLSLELKAARFDGDLPAFADRTKVWFTLELKL